LFPSTPTELPRPEETPLIGIGETPFVVPAPAHREPSDATANASPPAGSPTAATEAADFHRTGLASARSPAEADGVGSAPYTPPQVTGRGTGLRGRRGARGLDSRGLPIPDYPRQSRRLGETGTVVLDAVIRPDGHVGDVQVVTSSGFPLLDAAAVAALKEAEFTPALLSGQTVEGTVRVPYRFRLD
jgi:protein TonB